MMLLPCTRIMAPAAAYTDKGPRCGKVVSVEAAAGNSVLREKRSFRQGTGSYRESRAKGTESKDPPVHAVQAVHPGNCRYRNRLAETSQEKTGQNREIGGGTRKAASSLFAKFRKK